MPTWPAKSVEEENISKCYKLIRIVLKIIHVPFNSCLCHKMSTTLSKQDFHQHLEGTKATSGWDLLVSYDEEHLNRALAKKWKNTNKGSGVKFNLHSQPVQTIQIDQEFDVTLSPPSLKFSTLSKNALLGMVLNGSYTTTVTVSGQKQPPETKTLPMNAYRLDVALPISAVSGDGKVSVSFLERINKF